MTELHDRITVLLRVKHQVNVNVLRLDFFRLRYSDHQN